MTIKDKSKAFKAYDIRGEIGVTLDHDMAREIGMALVAELNAKTLAVGADNRPSSPELKAALIQGITQAGANAIDIGGTGTEEVYFAAQELNVDAGVQITASHNPIGDNGMKFIKRGGKPVEAAELNRIRDRVVDGHFQMAERHGRVSKVSILMPYVDHLLGYIDPKNLEMFKIVANPGNGMAGHVINAIEERLDQDEIKSPFIKMHFEPDARFPNGIPNPILPENREPTRQMVIDSGADFAVAWDGDFDRCFFFDENGDFIEGYYIVGMLAEAFLRKYDSANIVYDPRMTWNTIEKAETLGGAAIQSRVGHAFIKAKMREWDAVYGGEMSAHHYFRDFGYCDSGMIPWLLVAELLAQSEKSLSQLVMEAKENYPCSGEVNFRVEDTEKSIQAIRAQFEPDAIAVDETDGISMEYPQWRFNLRASNTEPLLRLNIESRGDTDLVEQKLAEIRRIIETMN